MRSGDSNVLVPAPRTPSRTAGFSVVVIGGLFNCSDQQVGVSSLGFAQCNDNDPHCAATGRKDTPLCNADMAYFMYTTP